MMRSFVRLCLVAAATWSLAAQDRDLVAGRVLTHSGEPWVGARVVLAAAPIPALPELAEIDRVEVTTTESGIFRARLLPELNYVAWVASFDDERRLRRTDLHRDVRPGVVLELVEIEPLLDPQIVVAGLETWQEFGPLRIELKGAFAELGVATVDLDDASRGDFPAWPREHVPNGVQYGISTRAILLDFEGQPLAAAPLRAAGVELGVPALIHTEFPPAHRVSILVRDGHGAPIAGARLRVRIVQDYHSDWPGAPFGYRSTLLWRDGPLTDADGRASVHVPLDASEAMLIEASKPGFARVHGGLHQGHAFLDGKRSRDRPPVWTFTLEESRPIAGMLQIVDGTPLTNHPVIVSVNSKIPLASGWEVLPRRFVVRTDSTGAFALDEPPADAYGASFHFALPADLHRIWANATEGILGRTAMAWRPVRDDQREFPAVSLTSLREVRITAVPPTSGPRARATALIVPIGPATADQLPDIPWLTATDARGRVALRLPPGRYGFVQFGDTDYYAEDFVVVAGDAPQELEFRPRAYAWMRLRVETADGLATTGNLWLRSPMFARMGEPVTPLSRTLNAIAPTLLQMASVDAGMLDLRLIPDISEAGARFQIRVPGHGTSEVIELRPSSERLTVRVR